jgi:hypothetical protein
MKTCLLLAALALAGCGATYRVTRTMPNGGTLEAYAYSSEKSEAITFTFEGDLDKGTVTKLTFKKVGAEPVNLTAQTLQTLLGGIGPVTSALTRQKGDAYDFTQEALRTNEKLGVYP